MADSKGENVALARSWTHHAGACCGRALGNILEAQRRSDGGGMSEDAVKSAVKDLDDARAHLIRALIYYEMAEDNANG